MNIDPVERYLFLEGIFLKYGYDFRQYAEASLDRRLRAICRKLKKNSLLEVLQEILHTPEQFKLWLPYLTIQTTEFFRDPKFFRYLREAVIPILKTYPRINVWSAGCSTGEELISLAILLREENLEKRTHLYATDINPLALKRAKAGIFELSTMQTFNKNYVEAGGSASPTEYYSADYGLACFDSSLLSNVVFSDHNLASDAPFLEANLILCRNVLIYFNRELQNRAFKLFAQSLTFKGFLGIGPKESLRFSTSFPYFDVIEPSLNVYGLKTKRIAEPLSERVNHEYS